MFEIVEYNDEKIKGYYLVDWMNKQKQKQFKELKKKIRFESKVLAILSLWSVPTELISNIEQIRCKDIAKLKELQQK